MRIVNHYFFPFETGSTTGGGSFLIVWSLIKYELLHKFSFTQMNCVAWFVPMTKKIAKVEWLIKYKIQQQMDTKYIWDGGEKPSQDWKLKYWKEISKFNISRFDWKCNIHTFHEKKEQEEEEEANSLESRNMSICLLWTAAYFHLSFCISPVCRFCWTLNARGVNQESSYI